MTSRPQAVRYISRRGESFDHYIRAQVDQLGFGAESVYFGIEDPGRAEEVRRGLRRAGKRLGVAVKVFIAPEHCTGCHLGGASCRYHVMFTSYDMEAARAYMAATAGARNWGGPQP